MTGTAASTGLSANRLSSLDGLRALAALAVFFHHVGFWTGATFNSWAGGLLARLDIGVPVFFVLSGFLMFRPVVVSSVHDVALRPASEHLYRRALRIYPAFWAALALIVLCTTEGFSDWGMALSTIGLVHTFWSDHVIGPMPHAWSLATEISFYAALPLMARLLRPVVQGVARPRAARDRIAALLAVVAALYLLSVFFRLWVHGLAYDWASAALLWLPAMIDYFAIGMALAVVHAGLSDTSAARRHLERWARPAGAWWLIAAALFVFVSEGMDLARGLETSNWPDDMARQAIYGVIGFSLIFPLVFASPQRRGLNAAGGDVAGGDVAGGDVAGGDAAGGDSAGGGVAGGDSAEGWVRRLMSSRPLVWLGTISYSFYLWHMVFIVHPWPPAQRAVERVWDATVRSGWFDAIVGWTGLIRLVDNPFTVLAVVAIGPTLATAAVSYLILERKGQALAPLLRRARVERTTLESLTADLARKWQVASFRMRLGIIAAVAAVVRLCYIIFAKHSETLVPDSVFPGDQFYYALAGDALADGKGFVVPWHFLAIREGTAAVGSAAPHAADHPPLTALAAAPAGFLPGEPGSHIFEQRLTMAAIGVAVVVVIGLLGRAVGGPRAGLAAAALAAIHAGFWINDGLVMSETLTTLAAAGVLWAAVRYWRTPGAARAAELGAWIGVGALTRSEMLLFGAVVVMPLLWVAHPRWRSRVKSALITAVAVTVLLAPWVIPNLVRFEQPVLLSSNVGITLVGANNPQTYGGDAIGFWSLEHPEQTIDVSGLDQSEQSRVYRSAAVDYALEHPQRWPAVIAARIGRVWGVYQPLQMLDWNQGEGRELWASMLAFTGYLALLPAAAIGWLTLRRPPRTNTAVAHDTSDTTEPSLLPTEANTSEGPRTSEAAIASETASAFRGSTVLSGRASRLLPRWLLAVPLLHVTLIAAVFYGAARLRVSAEVALVVLAAVAVVEWRPWRDVEAASEPFGDDRRVS